MANRRDVLIGMAGMAAAIATGRAALAATDYPADYANIVEASKSETSLTVYSVFGEEFWPFVLEPFNAKYPWITVNYLDLAGAEAVQRYLVEQNAGSQSTDMMVLNSPQAWANLAERGLVVDYQSPEIPFLPEAALRLRGVYGILVDGEVFAWNKRLLAPELVPTTLEDFAAKAGKNGDVFKGRTVAFPAMEDAYRKLAMLWLIEKHGEKIWPWLQKIGPNVRFETSSGTMVEKILSGEYLIGMGVPLARCLTTMQDPAKAAIFDWGYMADGTTVGARQAGIVKGGASPNSARLLLDSLLSAEGQAGVAKSNKIPIRDVDAAALPPGIVTLKQISDKIGASNIIDVYYDKAMEERHPDFDSRYKAAFNFKG